jgi:hypothetical protein
MSQPTIEDFERLIEENAELRARNEHLEGILDGDPSLTATREQRSLWRHTAVRYADKVEKENAALREELMLKNWQIKTLTEIVNRSGLQIGPPAPDRFSHCVFCPVNFEQHPLLSR